MRLTEREFGIALVIAALPEKIAGCAWRERNKVVLWVNGTHASVRQRFTLAHELGHVRCGHDGRVAVDTFETLSGRTTDSREVQANAFAAELLAPAAGVERLVEGEPTLEDVVRIADIYRISPVASLYRMNSLGLTRRYEQLKRELAEGLHSGLPRYENAHPDVIQKLTIEELPRFSPQLAQSALVALAHGEASVADAAGRAGCTANRLSAAIGLLGP